MTKPITYQVTVYPDGTKGWHLNGELHREDGPAIEYTDGSKSWWINGKLHRENGPAIEFANGNRYWCLNGKEYSEKEYNEKMKPSCESKIIEIDGKKYKLTKA